MIKRLVVLAMVALVVLVVVTPAWAAANGQEGPGSREQQLFSVAGTVTATDTVNETITIVAEGGSWAVWLYIGDELTVQMANETVYFEGTGEGRLLIDLDGVDVNDVVNIQGTVGDDGALTADRVIVE